MATVTVCDICGKRILATKYKIKRVGLLSSDYDLCPECMKEMSNWIKIKTQNENK